MTLGRLMIVMASLIMAKMDSDTESIKESLKMKIDGQDCKIDGQDSKFDGVIITITSSKVLLKDHDPLMTLGGLFIALTLAQMVSIKESLKMKIDGQDSKINGQDRKTDRVVVTSTTNSKK